MKKVVGIIAAVLFVAALATYAIAQEDLQGGPGMGMGMGPGPGPMMQDDQNLTPEQFKERKERILKMFEEREKRIAQEKACVQAASNMEELRKCRPARPHGPGGKRGGQGRMPMGGMQ